MENALKKYFGIIVDGQTYLNVLYLLLAFPLGTLYFSFLVTGLSVGIGTLIVWVGIPILLLVFAAAWGLAVFERWQAIVLLKEDIPPMSRAQESSASAWERLKAHFGNPVTWKSLLYLLLKFVLGTLTFVIAVTLISVSVSLLISPLLYSLWDYPSGWVFWRIDTLGESLIVALLSLLVVGPISLHITNYLARVSGAMARAMLSAARHEGQAAK